MTATKIEGNTFSLDISRESLNKTVGLDTVGPVNLEKAMRLNDRLGGHLVSGHVDGMGKVTDFAAVAQDAYGSWLLRIEAPKELAAFLAYKGSIVVNGVSLTVNKTEDLANACVVDINIIPHTWDVTTLGALVDYFAFTKSKTPTLVLEIGTDSTHSFIVSSSTST